jgi:hypothetical protein
VFQEFFVDLAAAPSSAIPTAFCQRLVSVAHGAAQTPTWGFCLAAAQPSTWGFCSSRRCSAADVGFLLSRCSDSPPSDFCHPYGFLSTWGFCSSCRCSAADVGFLLSHCSGVDVGFPTRLGSLKRLLSRDRRISPRSPSDVDVEQQTGRC